MTGKGHIASGTILAADAIACGLLATREAAPAAVVFIGNALSEHLGPYRHYGGAAGVAACAGCAALYYFGLLLPDIDSPNSTISRKLRFSLPFRHRGWTHSIWFLLPWAVLGATAAWPARFVFLGMLAHDLADSLSTAGWAAFYPLGRWRAYHDTVMSRGFCPQLYSSSSPGSEALVNGALLLISLAAAGTLAYLVLWAPTEVAGLGT